MPGFESLPTTWDPLVQLWLLRILVLMDGHRFLVDEKRVLEPGILRCIGIELQDKSPLPKGHALLASLRGRLTTMENIAPKPPQSTTLMKNVTWLGRSLCLSNVEIDIVLFLALEHHSDGLDKLLERFGQLKTHEVHALIALATGHPYDQVSSALLHTGKLVRSSLVSSDLSSQFSFESKIKLLSGIPDALAIEHKDPSELFLSNFKRSGSPDLGLDDYPHLDDDLQILEGLLRGALDSRSKGVNVLLWGPPGTGKTQLAKVLAARLGSPLYEIAVEDRHGNIHKGDARLGSFQLAQGVLGGEPWPLILFDEVEDVFRSPDEVEKAPASGNRSGNKGWVNRMLEENPVPAFWITNARGVLDPAYRRRFDYAMEVGVPPRSVRAKMLDHHLAGLPVTSLWKATAAEFEDLSPAGIERAAKVTRMVLAIRPDLVADRVVDRVLGNALAAVGTPRNTRTSAYPSTTYRLEVLNTDRNLGVICAGLKRSGSGRLCLYGPPGTGKTAFGRYLAEALDRPLLVKRASDLQSKWLGEAEQNIARMFRDATAEGAVLLLDEADTFLQDRRGAARSWEVSQVNEMLTQMEACEGIFIASTNLLGTLDQASLRRFDIKLKFNFLRRDQILTMFRDALAILGMATDRRAESRVGQFTTLTPGDFAVVLRQARLTGIDSPADFVTRLEAECSLKEGGFRRSIGFGHPGPLAGQTRDHLQVVDRISPELDLSE